MNRIIQYLSILWVILMMAACSGSNKKIVAVSQCSMDEWRNQMNKEMEHEAFFHKNLAVEIHSTPDDTRQQIKDIESFIDRKVDAIVVAPNEWEPLRPVIEKAHDAGIPVVLVDRKVNSDKYTAFVGGDNVEVGRRAAHYIIDHLPEGGNIIEIEGLQSSTSSQERKQGLHEVLDSFPQIKIVANTHADWKRQMAYDMMQREICPKLKDTPIDIVFAYNDRMAIGAKESYIKNSREGIISSAKMPLFIGVDALLNDSLGIGRVEDGTLDASFLYQTGGDKAIHTVACILDGKPYDREMVFETSIVTKGNVHLMRIQANHIEEQDSKIEFLNRKLDDFFEQYSAQRALLITFIILVVVVCALLAVSLHGYNTKHKFNLKLQHQKDILKRQRDELAEQKETVERQRDMLEEEREKLIDTLTPTLSHGDDRSEESTPALVEDDPFMKKLQQVIDKNFANSDLTVDMIGAEVNLGRVQLYRRCKAACGMSPNELLRTSRLNKAYQLLRDKDMTVSEVAYAVGFSSPSYFAKCYKDLFGKNPTDAQKK
ncbi:MAG: substrate-binding domain-containing protein [Bacteroidaceae bacterium]|nr:substrate-binding domain-containing protein [Bacteroidaceae bacterium]